MKEYTLSNPEPPETPSGEQVASDALLSAHIAGASLALLKVVRRASQLDEQGKLNKYQSIHAHLAVDAIEKIGRHSISDNARSEAPAPTTEL